MSSQTNSRNADAAGARPKGYLYRRTRMNAAATLFWATLLVVVYILYMINAWVYFVNALSKGRMLNTDKFSAATHMLVIEPQTEAFDCSGYGVATPAMLRLDEVYRDGSRYRFMLTIDAVRETGIGYVKAPDGSRQLVRAENGVFPEPVENRIMVVTAAGHEYAAIIPEALDIEPGITLPKAVFLGLPLYIGHDLGLTGEAGAELGNWCLDMRGLSVDDEGSHFAMVVIFSLLFPLFFLYSLACFIWPRLHINYLLLGHFVPDLDEACRELDEEIQEEDTYKEGKLVYTRHYIVRETLYSSRVTMNHTFRH